MRVWTGLEITCLHYPLPGIAPTQERAGGNLRRGRLKARGEVYHRFDFSVNQFVAFGRRFSLMTEVTRLRIVRPFDTWMLRRYSRRSEVRQCLSFRPGMKTCQ